MGINKLHRVDVLAKVCQLALRWLNSEKLEDFIIALSNPYRHRDRVLEFAPLLQAQDLQNAVYEEPTRGMEEKRIDWTLKWKKISRDVN